MVCNSFHVPFNGNELQTIADLNLVTHQQKFLDNKYERHK